jgi:hypothetical protein
MLECKRSLRYGAGAMTHLRASKLAIPVLTAIVLLMTTALVRVQGGPPARPAGQGGAPPGGGVGNGATPVAYDDYTGFTKLWNGQTLDGWNGESDVWSIVNGTIHADTTKTPGQHHLHYAGPGAVMGDFDLKVEFKISATGANGGIQYRSRMLYAPHSGSIQDPLGKPMPAGVTTFLDAVKAGIAERAPARSGPGPGSANATPSPTAGFQNPWQVSGYQFDLDSNNRYTGQLYEGQGRGIVNLPGGIVKLLPDRNFQKIGATTETPAAAVKPHQGVDGAWQQVQIIARGNVLTHVLNGQVITVTIDDDPALRALQGILSLQLEGSGQIWYRNVYLRTLPPAR